MAGENLGKFYEPGLTRAKVLANVTIPDRTVYGLNAQKWAIPASDVAGLTGLAVARGEAQGGATNGAVQVVGWVGKLWRMKASGGGLTEANKDTNVYVKDGVSFYKTAGEATNNIILGRLRIIEDAQWGWVEIGSPNTSA